jgi:hypothetical protein
MCLLRLLGQHNMLHVDLNGFHILQEAAQQAARHVITNEAITA